MPCWFLMWDSRIALGSSDPSHGYNAVMTTTSPRTPLPPRRLSPGVPGTAGNRARECHISDDGVVHLVAEDSASTLQALAALDMGRARLLARVAHFWRRRAW